MKRDKIKRVREIKCNENWFIFCARSNFLWDLVLILREIACFLYIKMANNKDIDET